MMVKLAIVTLFICSQAMHAAELVTIIDFGHGYSPSDLKKEPERPYALAREIENWIDDRANDLRLSMLNALALVNPNRVKLRDIPPFFLDPSIPKLSNEDALAFLAIRRYNGLLNVLCTKYAALQLDENRQLTFGSQELKS